MRRHGWKQGWLWISHQQSWQIVRYTNWQIPRTRVQRTVPNSQIVGEFFMFEKTPLFPNQPTLVARWRHDRSFTARLLLIQKFQKCISRSKSGNNISWERLSSELKSTHFGIQWRVTNPRCVYNSCFCRLGWYSLSLDRNFRSLGFPATIRDGSQWSHHCWTATITRLVAEVLATFCDGHGWILATLCSISRPWGPTRYFLKAVLHCQDLLQRDKEKIGVMCLVFFLWLSL